MLPQVIVFDVNETLLDLAGLDPFFEQRFGDRHVRREWFEQMLRSAFLATITNRYQSFAAIGAAALNEMADRQGVSLETGDLDRLSFDMRHLPAHPDVRPGIQMLRDAGFRTAALTNSTLAVGREQLRNAAVDDLFEAILSADTVSRLKPAPEPYWMAAETLGIDPGSLMMVAAHGWDVAGAMAAGCRAAFVARPGQRLDPLAPKPDIVAPDLIAAADALIEMAADVESTS